MNVSDPTFGVDRYAWSLLTLLSTYEPDFADFNEASQQYDVRLQTDVYSAGTRRWVSLTLFRTSTSNEPLLTVAFGRDPFVDEIVVECAAPGQGNKPSQHRFDPSDLMDAASRIRHELGFAYRAVQA